MTRLVETRPAAGLRPPVRAAQVTRHGRGLAGHVPGDGYAALAVVIDAGAGTDPPGAWGLASLLASLVIEGAAGRTAEQLDLAIESLGGRWFSSCDYDRVLCGVYAPVGALPQLAGIAAEVLWQPDLPAERVAQRRAERIEAFASRATDPGYLAAQAFRRGLWTSTDRYSGDDDGEPWSLPQVERDDLVRFHAQRWRPEEAVPIVAGDLSSVDVEAVLRSLAPGAGDQPAAPVVGLVGRPPERRVVLVDRPGSVQSAVLMGHRGPAEGGVVDVPTSLAMRVLAGHFGSRLNRVLREEWGVTYGVHGTVSRRRDAGQTWVSTSVRSDATVRSVVEIDAAITAMAAEGPSSEELEESRSAVLEMRVQGHRRAQQLAGHLSSLAVHRLPVDHDVRVVEAYERLTLGEVRSAAAADLRPHQLLTVVVGDAATCADGLSAAGLGPVDVVT